MHSPTSSFFLALALYLSNINIAVLAHSDLKTMPFLTTGLAQPDLSLSSSVPNASTYRPQRHTAKQPSYPEPPSEPPRFRILSYYPMIIHLENHLSAGERRYLLNLATPLLKRPGVVGDDGQPEFADSARTSSTAYLPYRDPIVTRIAKRTAEFQGYQPRRDIDLQVTSYAPGQFYVPHFDWFADPHLAYHKQRLSTLFVILDGECEKCGTQFTNLGVDWRERDRRWCRFVDCEEGILTTRFRVGDAVFWVNLDEEGRGREDVLHAGLPLPGNGTKVGLNVWTELGDE